MDVFSIVLTGKIPVDDWLKFKIKTHTSQLHHIRFHRFTSKGAFSFGKFQSFIFQNFSSSFNISKFHLNKICVSTFQSFTSFWNMCSRFFIVIFIRSIFRKMTHPGLLVDIKDGIMTITFNQPRKKNPIGVGVNEQLVLIFFLIQIIPLYWILFLIFQPVAHKLYFGNKYRITPNSIMF